MPAFQAILDRYILKQMRIPFLFGVAIFTALGLFIGIAFHLIRLMSERGLSPMAALQIFLLQAPSFIVPAMPMAVLLTTLMVYGQLSRQSEITAMKAAGITLLRIAQPAIIASMLLALLTFTINETIAPPTNYQSSLVQDRALNQERTKFQSTNIFYRDFDGRHLKHIFFAREFDGQKMYNISLLQFAEGRLDQIITAATGQWQEQTQQWDFQQGTIYFLGEDNSYRQIAPFIDQAIDLPRTPLSLAGETRWTTQMNLQETYQLLNLVEQTGDPKRIQSLRLAIQQRLSLPLACVAFSLVGTALGLRPRRANDAPGFGLSMAIIFGYYILEATLTSLGQGGVIAPVIAAWLPELSCLTVGVVLMWQTQNQ